MAAFADGRGFQVLGAVVWGPLCGGLHWASNRLQVSAVLQEFLANQGLLDLPAEYRAQAAVAAHNEQLALAAAAAEAEPVQPRRVEDLTWREQKRAVEEIKQRELAELHKRLKREEEEALQALMNAKKKQQKQHQQPQQQEDDMLNLMEESDDVDYDEDDFDPFVFISTLGPVDRYAQPGRQPLLPCQTRTCKQKTLVLDLDETLVHSTLDAAFSNGADFSFPVMFNGAEHMVHVRQRPHMQAFLERVATLFEVVVFTASQKVYAEKLLNILDPHRQLIRHRIYRDSCVLVDGNYLKDLSVLGRDLKRCAIVDNSPQAFGFQLANGIPIESWYDDPEDSELLQLLPFLEAIAHCDVTDVRPAISSRFNLAAKPMPADAADDDQRPVTADGTNEPLKKQKRNVALHVGYVGTSYTGLQANRELPELATIEGVLEKAILAAGLITPANFGDFRKTKWTRSSRTDKGVHSLGTVIGLRVLVRDEDYDADPEGIRYARLINQHLPDDVRVLSVQKTNKSFNARRWCGSRTYEYYLPAAVLGLDTADGCSADDQQKLQLLRDVLQQYCGYRAFHNYAGNRSQYVGQKQKELMWKQQVKFLDVPDPDDPVVKSHYRMIRSFTADDPTPLVEGGVPCLRLEVCGDSFMLHQIRHMVGCAVAIVRGIMPKGLLDVSLSAPGRVTLPRAPPHSLLLSSSLFNPFPAGWGLDSPIVAQWTGDRLRLREQGQGELLEFRHQVFDAAINQLLQHPDWEAWSRQILPRYDYPADDVAAAVDSHTIWITELRARRAAAHAEWKEREAAEVRVQAEAEAELHSATCTQEAADVSSNEQPAAAGR
eukprot:gene3564-3832_t